MTARIFERKIGSHVEEGIDEARITFVAGARQVGKTTLMRQLTAAGGDHPMREISLDDTAAGEAANADPGAFVAGLDGPSFIDEIHRAPSLLLELKEAVDGCPIAPAAIESPGVSEALRAVTAGAFSAREDAFATALARDRPAGVARAQAGVLLSAIEGAQLLDRPGRQCGHLLALREAVPSLVARP